MISLSKATPALLSIFVFCVSAFAQNECEPLLQNGLYENFKITKANTFSMDFRTYLLSDTFKSDLKNGKWGGSITVPVKGQPVSLGADANNEEVSSFQQLIRQETSLSISSSDYQVLTSSIPNVRLGEVYADCLDKQSNRTFRVIAQYGEDWASFDVKYNPSAPQDPLPKLQLFEVMNGANVSTTLKTGEAIGFSNLIRTGRDSKKDLVLSFQTDRGSVRYKIPGDAKPESAKDMPVGTIIASYLDVEHFYLATKNNERSPGGTWTAAKSKWCPADGRVVPGSLFLEIASQDRVPDLRGMFLRGLNVMEPVPQVSLSPDRSDPENRAVGSYQADEIKTHRHGYREPDGGGGSVQRGGMGLEPKITDPTGGSETRPKNVAVYYYIRIN